MSTLLLFFMFFFNIQKRCLSLKVINFLLQCNEPGVHVRLRRFDAATDTGGWDRGEAARRPQSVPPVQPVSYAHADTQRLVQLSTGMCG